MYNKIIILILFIFLLSFKGIGCFCKSKFERNNKIIEYGTDEFKKFEKKAKIKLKAACEIYYRKIVSKENINRDTVSFAICINNSYFFSNGYFLKINSIALSGYCIDSTTGKIFYKSFEERLYKYKQSLLRKRYHYLIKKSRG